MFGRGVLCDTSLFLCCALKRPRDKTAGEICLLNKTNFVYGITK